MSEMEYKISTLKLAIWTFIISTLFSGVAWEAVGWLSLFYCYVKCKTVGLFKIKRKNVPLIILLGIIIGYVTYQCFVLHLDTNGVLRLYGITKTLFVAPVIILLIKDYLCNEDVVIQVLPLILIIDWISIASKITGNEYMNVLSGSINYLGAINVVLFPYLFKFVPENNHVFLKRLYYITLLSLVIFSGSRTTMLTFVVIFCSTTLLEKNINKKIKYLLFIGLIGAVGIFALNNIVSDSLVARGLSAFSNLFDASRSGLKMFAKRQYSNYSTLQKLIGNGNTIVLSQQKPVHNVFGEILLCYGKIGLIAWIIYLIGCVFYIIKSSSKNKLYIMILIGITLMIGWVQPFLTSGYLFQVLVAIILVQMYISDTPEEINMRSVRNTD